jgi:CubicO group peptidase (beta-lactamase class C family)
MILLSDEAFRPKVRKCINSYLDISPSYSLTLGIYKNGKSFLFSNESDILAQSYDVGSISKTATAHLILFLAEEGKIDLASEISEYLDLPKGRYPTVYQLLTHTAGYHNLTPVEITLPPLIRHGYARKNIYEGCTSDRVINCLKRRRMTKASGYGYSDFAFAILGVVAERVTGRVFGELFEEFVRERLNMKSTSVIADPKARLPLSADRGRIYDFWKWKYDNPYVAGGGLVSNIEDMMNYLILEITSKENYVTKAHNICPESISKGSNIATCIGWHTYKKSNQLWHVGGVGTFRSSVIFNKKNRVAVAVLGNAKGVASANVHYLAKMLYSELKINKIDFSHLQELNETKE